MARVYLCEDDDAFRSLTRAQLEEHGHEVVGESGDGAHCVRALPATDPDVALVDGLLDAGQWAAIRERCRRTRLVLYSGMPRRQLWRRGWQLGADKAVPKGHDVRELSELIAQLAT